MTNISDKKQIEQISDKYRDKQNGKVDELKALHKKVQTPPRALAYTLGIIGTLILGVGMCVCLGAILENLFALGVVLGIIGIAMAVANVFIYKAFLSARKKKYGAQILALADELNDSLE